MNRFFKIPPILLLLGILPQHAVAEFYSWIDSNGIRHYSTHHKSCQKDGYFNRIKPGCTPLRLTAEEKRARARQAAIKQAAEERQAAIERCESLESRIENIRKEIKETVSGASTLGGALSASLSSPILHSAFLDAHRKYDDCVSEDKIPKRVTYRNSIRQQMANNARQIQLNQQRYQINSIEDGIRDIKREVGIW